MSAPTIWSARCDLAGLEQLAGGLAPLLRAGDAIGLAGDLGAGKTTFARLLLRALGEAGEIPSPTFNLVLPYAPGGFDVAHVDLFRIADPSEIEELGAFATASDGVLLVEWPERAGPAWPVDALMVGLAADADPAVRIVTVAGPAAWRARLAGRLP